MSELVFLDDPIEGRLQDDDCQSDKAYLSDMKGERKYKKQRGNRLHN